MSNDHPPAADPVRQLLNRCETIAILDPEGAAGRVRTLLADYYRVLAVSSPAEAAAAGAELLVIASVPGRLPASNAWPPAVWLQPGVPVGGIPPDIAVYGDEDLGAAFTARFLSSCSG